MGAMLEQMSCQESSCDAVGAAQAARRSRPESGRLATIGFRA